MSEDAQATVGDNKKYYLLFDANIWVSERMLRSSAGEAVLFAIAASGGAIILPDIVKMEVDRVLKAEAAKASSTLRKNIELLRQLSGHAHMLQPVPTENAIDAGVARRWKELDGIIIPAPFTFEQAQASLQRILNHTPPCGENNEQFRDCCIWETAVEFSAASTVHFVTNDSAFYDSRERTNVAAPLRNELESLGRNIRLYRTIRAFLEAVSQDEITVPERTTICDAVVAIVTPRAQDIAAERISKESIHGVKSDRFLLSEAQTVSIKGYATPRPSMVAITFEVSFDLSLFRGDQGSEEQTETILKLEGSCSYDPNSRAMSDLVISSWTNFLKPSGGVGWSIHSPMTPDFARQMKETRYL